MKGVKEVFVFLIKVIVYINGVFLMTFRWLEDV